MLVRKYKQDDEKGLIELWKIVFPDDPPHNDPSSVLKAKTKVDDLIFVAEREQKIVGACMAGYDGHRGWLYAVAVLPEFRRSGLGKNIINTVVEELKNLGCIKLNLQIRSSNAEVAAFYQALGFKVEDRLSMGMLLD